MKIYLRAVIFAFIAVTVLVSTCIFTGRAGSAGPPNIFQFK